MPYPPALQAVLASVRPALQAADTTPRDRAEFLYDLTREVYDHVKFDIHGANADTPERGRIGQIVDAALPPTFRELAAENE